MKARTRAPRPTGRSSVRHPPTPISANGFVLSGPSAPPDPRFNAYRKYLADVRLAGYVIASHYAEAVERRLAIKTELRANPSNEGEILLELEAGEPFSLLDDSMGWAWGYAGKDARVGYIKSDAILK